MRSVRHYLYAGIGFFVLDRIAKYAAVHNPMLAQDPLGIPGVVGITVYINRTFAWSLPISNTISAVCMAVALIALFWFLVASARQYRADGWVIFFAAFSNFIDRLVYGGVIDYIIVPFGGIINIADIVVLVAGCALLMRMHRQVKL